MKRITKAAAFKRFTAGNSFLVCPVKLRPDGPFSPAFNCLSGKEWIERAASHGDKSPLWAGTLERTAWEMMLSNWAYYNTSYEAGYYAAFYVQN